MYQNILVAVDGSETSKLALKEAITLTKETQAKLRLLHVADVMMVNQDMEFVDIYEFRETFAKAGRKILEDAQKFTSDEKVTAETKLIEIDKFGQRIPEIIVKEADDWPADLIVLGTHGRRGFSHLLLGSVAEGVVRLANKPVLLIRGE